jgi:hypothetical protein
MPSQPYRGHMIDVTCHLVAGRIAYRSSIRTCVTGELRQTGGSQNDFFASQRDAHDRAFTDGRGWIDRFPLRWPF